MNLLKHMFCLSCGAAIPAMLLAPGALAASFTILDGQTVTTTQVLDTPGDIGRVEQGGTINVNDGIGIRATVDGVTVNNAGSVTGSGDVSAGIRVNNGSTIINAGRAEGGLFGIVALGNGNTISNAGTVGGDIIGIFAVGAGNTISNTGRAEGAGFGIILEGAGNTLSNTGTASGLSGIRVEGSENTIILLSGSTIEGTLEFVGDSNRLIIGSGLDAAFTFTGTPTISTEGAAHVVSGNTVYTVNSTPFAVQDDLTGDLTRAVTGAVEDRLAAVRRLDGGLRVALNGLTIAAAADPSLAPDTGFWLSGLAASRRAKQEGTWRASIPGSWASSAASTAC